MALKKLVSSMLPGGMHLARVTFGAKSTDNPDVLWPATDISAGTVLFKAPVGTVITNVRFHIGTAFGSTGAFIMNVGDATDPDGWFESTDLVASDVGKHVASWSLQSTGIANPNAFAKGKEVSTGNTLDADNLESVVVVTVGTAPLNAGLADFYVEYFNKNELSPL